jgi:hypothetical protein
VFEQSPQNHLSLFGLGIHPSALVIFREQCALAIPSRAHRVHHGAAQKAPVRHAGVRRAWCPLESGSAGHGACMCGAAPEDGGRAGRLGLLRPRAVGWLSYGPPWAHCLGGYQDRLLGGPLGLPGLRYTAPEGVEHKDSKGVVLG